MCSLYISMYVSGVLNGLFMKVQYILRHSTRLAIGNSAIHNRMLSLNISLKHIYFCSTKGYYSFSHFHSLQPLISHSKEKSRHGKIFKGILSQSKTPMLLDSEGSRQAPKFDNGWFHQCGTFMTYLSFVTESSK